MKFSMFALRSRDSLIILSHPDMKVNPIFELFCRFFDSFEINKKQGVLHELVN